MSDFFTPSYWYGAGPGAAFADVNAAVAHNQANMIPNMNAYWTAPRMLELQV